MDQHTANDTTSLGKISVTRNLTEDSQTFMEEVEGYMALKVVEMINYYWFPILGIIGFVGNTLSFSEMIKPNNKKMSI